MEPRRCIARSELTVLYADWGGLANSILPLPHLWIRCIIATYVPLEPIPVVTEMTVRNSPWFVLIVAVFVTCLITANIIAVKLVNIFDLIVPAAVVIFPLSYIFGDVLTE